MGSIHIVRRCYNCGTILQSEDKNAPGYIDPEILKITTARVLFCDKCYDESRYNFVPRTPKVSADYLSMLQDAEASDALIVYVVDLFSFENSFIPEVTEAIEGLDILVIANKRDLLPKSCKDEELREYVAHRCRNARLKVTRDDVILTSLTSMGDLGEIREEIEKRRKRHDVYVIGAVGAGKTQLISSFLHGFTNRSNRAIGMANYPGTSLRVMQIPLDTSSYAYDTPGTSVDNHIQTKLDLEGVRAITPSSAVKARSFTMAEGDTLLVGGLVRIELLKGEKQTIKAYFAEDVTLTKAKHGKGEEMFFRSIQTGSSVPNTKALSSPSDFDAYDLEITETGSRDIGIAGLGWINFEGNAQTWRLFPPKNVSIYATRAKIK